MTVENEITLYEAERLKNIQKNKEILEGLKITHNWEVKKKVKKVNERKSEIVEPTELRRSTRARKTIIQYSPPGREKLTTYIIGERFLNSVKANLNEEELAYARKFLSLKPFKRSLEPALKSWCLDISSDDSNILVAVGDDFGYVNFFRWSEMDIALQTEEQNSDSETIEANNTDTTTKKVHSDTISSLRFLKSDLKKLITSSFDGRAILIDIEKFSKSELFSDISVTSLTDIMIAPDINCYLLSTGNGQLISVDQRHKYNFKKNRIHSDVISSLEINQSNMNYFTSASYDGTVKIFDVRSVPQPVYTIDLETMVGHSIFSPDGNYLLTYSNDNLVKSFHFNKGTVPKKEKNIGFVSVLQELIPPNLFSQCRIGFDPKTKSSFAFQSPETQQSIDIIEIKEKEFQRLMNLRSNSRSVHARAVFHEKLNLVAAISGKTSVVLWK